MKSKYIFTPGLVLALSLSAAAQSDAQKSFDQRKTLAGCWEAV